MCHSQILLNKIAISIFFVFLLQCKDKKKSAIKPLKSYSHLDEIIQYDQALKKSVTTNPKAACSLGRHRIRWFLVSRFNQKTEWFKKLLDNAEITCGNNNSQTCARKFFRNLENIFNLCQEKFPEKSRKGLDFIYWQAIEKTKWNEKFFRDANKLLKTDYKTETRIVLLGALGHFLELGKKIPLKKRLTYFIRILSVPCPALADKWEETGALLKGTDLSKSGYCLPDCAGSKIKEPMLDFARRRRQVIKNCSPQSLGLQSKTDKKLISADNYLVFKTAQFYRQMVASLMSSRELPAPSVRKQVKKINSELKNFHIWLSYPVLDSFEKGFIEIPLSVAPQHTPDSSWFIQIDQYKNLRMDKRPVFNPGEGKIISGNYPGKLLKKNWRLLVEYNLKKNIDDPPTLILDSKLKSQMLLNLFQTILGTGENRVELLMRNNKNILRVFEVGLIDKIPEENRIIAQVGPGIMTLSADKGYLKENPYKTDSPYDFSGLRQFLQRLRWKYKYSKKTIMIIKLNPGLSYLTVSKLLGFLSRNSSGRKLFAKIKFYLESPENKEENKSQIEKTDETKKN
ncbi:MAG: hypothetical protein ACQES9_08285 [Myxococcota bacterium]